MTITINGFVIDAALHETHTYESEVTEYPVESGAMVTDNIRPKPKQVEIEGVVSDTPLPGTIANARGADSQGNLNSIPSDDALAALEAIYLAREPVTIETSLKRYDNMAMTNLVIPRDAGTGYALSFTASFQEVQFVTNNRATIRVSPPHSTGLGAKKDLGHRVVKIYSATKPIIWHHSSPLPVFSTSEVLGYDTTKQNLYYQSGFALSDVDQEQFEKDQALWFQTHNSNGELITDPTEAFANRANPEGRVVTAPDGTPLGVHANNDGTWVDDNGDPITYNPNWGRWVELDPF